jgi:hypothetical protein
MRHAIVLVPVAAALSLAALGCASRVEPAAEICALVLARRLPAARVVTAVAAPPALEAAIDFEVGGGWWTQPSRGSLRCAFEAGERGSLRLRGATLNGVAFTRAELTIVNADLLLADMRRADAEARPD